MRTYRNPRMDRPINELMEFDHVVAVMPDGRVIDVDEGFNHLDVYAPEVVIDYDGPFAEAQISKQHDADMVEHLREQGWEVLSGYSGQNGYAGPVMHTSEFIGGGIEDRIREEPGYWVALTVEIHPKETDPEYNDGSGESDAAGWIVARKIGSEDEIAARTGWIAEEMAPWHFDPSVTRRPMSDEDAAMSAVQVFYKGNSEDAARNRLAEYWVRCAHMNHVKVSGEQGAYQDAAARICDPDAQVYSLKPAYRTGRVRAYLKPKETA